MQISPSKDGEKYEIVAKSPAKAPKSPPKQTPPKQLKTPSKPLKTPTKFLSKTPQKTHKETLNPGFGVGDLGRRRRVVLIPVERRSPLKSELQSNWEAGHDIINLDNCSACIR